jgi:hypothetical protein
MGDLSHSMEQVGEPLLAHRVNEAPASAASPGEADVNPYPAVEYLRQALDEFQTRIDANSITILETRAANVANQILQVDPLPQVDRGSGLEIFRASILISRAFLSLQSEEAQRVRLAKAGQGDFERHQRMVATAFSQISNMFHLPSRTTIDTLVSELRMNSCCRSERLDSENSELRRELEQLRSDKEHSMDSLSRETELSICRVELAGKRREVENPTQALEGLSRELTDAQRDLSERDARSQKLFQIAEVQSAMISRFEAQMSTANARAQKQEVRIVELTALLSANAERVN